MLRVMLRHRKAVLGAANGVSPGPRMASAGRCRDVVQMSPTWQRRPAPARIGWGAAVAAKLLHRQLEHPGVAGFGDVEVAGGIHRHVGGAHEAGEWQHRLGGRAGRQLQHPVFAAVGDVVGRLRPRYCAGSFSTRLPSET